MLSDEIMTGHFGVRQEFTYRIQHGPFHHFANITRPNGVKDVYDHCSVDIIIPYHGQYDLVRRALLSILKFTQSNPYQVTLVDDGSRGEAAINFLQTISQAPQLQCIRLEKQQGFGSAVIAGLQKTTQPYVCIMHSDCEVRNLGWLEAMGESLVTRKKDNIRLVSARSNNPGKDAPEGLFAEMHSAKDADLPKEIIVDEPLPMYCCMCHRGLFRRIGDIQPYPYTWYENEEFFYRMKHYGYHQAIATRSWVSHKGGATVREVLQKDPSLEDVMLANRDRCLADLKPLYKQ